MNSFTMNHLSTEEINAQNDYERKKRHHHEHADEIRFAITLMIIGGGFALAVIFL